MNLKYFYSLLILIFSLGAVNAQPLKNNNEWTYGHCIKEVHFGGTVGSNYIPITKDDGSIE